MWRVVLALLAAAAAGDAQEDSFGEYAAAKMPQYGAGDYGPSRDLPLRTDDSRGHSPDASASPDYKYEEDLSNSNSAKSSWKNREVEHVDIWQKPVGQKRRRARTDSDDYAEVLDKHSLDIPKFRSSYTKQRPGYKFQKSERDNYSSRIKSQSHLRHDNDLVDDGDADDDATRDKDFQVRQRHKGEDEVYSHSEATERIIKRKPRDRQRLLSKNDYKDFDLPERGMSDDVEVDFGRDMLKMKGDRVASRDEVAPSSLEDEDYFRHMFPEEQDKAQMADDQSKRGPFLPDEQSKRGPFLPDEQSKRGPFLPDEQSKRGPFLPDEQSKRGPFLPEEQSRRGPFLPDEQSKRGPFLPEEQSRRGQFVPDEQSRQDPFVPDEQSRRGPFLPDAQSQRDPLAPGERVRPAQPKGGTRKAGVDHYEDYYDMKRVQNMKKKLPEFERRTKARGSRPLVPRPATWSLRRRPANRRVFDVEPGSTEVTRTSLNLADGTLSTVSQSNRSASTASTKNAPTTAAATVTRTTPMNKSQISPLSLGEKSRLSILKKALKKELEKGPPKEKPAVLLHMTSKMPTVVMVEPVSKGDKWMRAREVGPDTPQRIARAKTLMRQKLVAGARSVHELTDNWDDMICEYIDTSLLDTTATGPPPPKLPARLFCICVLFYFMTHI